MLPLCANSLPCAFQPWHDVPSPAPHFVFSLDTRNPRVTLRVLMSWPSTELSEVSDLVGNLGIDYLKLSRWFLGNLRATVQKFLNLSFHHCFPSAKTKPYVRSTVNVYQHDGSDLSVSSWKPLGHRSMSLSRYKAGERAARDPWGAARPCGSGPCSFP